MPESLLTVEDRLTHAHDRLVVAVTVWHPTDDATTALVSSACRDSVADLEAIRAALEHTMWGRASLSTAAPSVETRGAR